MSLGLVIAAMSDSEATAVMLAVSIFFPIFLVSGIIWPLQAIPWWARWVSFGLSSTWAAEALRDIISRGWGLSYFDVWMGFILSLGWDLLLVAIAIIGLLPSRTFSCRACRKRGRLRKDV